MPLLTRAVAALIGGLVMAQSGVAGATAARAIEGQWGGDRMNLLIDAAGGQLELDCASGRMVGAVRWDANGRFSARGTFDQQQAGPQRADADHVATPARYSGEVKAETMTLSILTEGAQAPQVFNLRKGARVKLLRCL